MNITRISVCTSIEPDVVDSMLTEVEEFVEVIRPDGDDARTVTNFVNVNYAVFEEMARNFNVTFDYSVDEGGFILFVENIAPSEAMDIVPQIADAVFLMFNQDGFKTVSRGVLTQDTDVMYLDSQQLSPSQLN